MSQATSTITGDPGDIQAASMTGILQEITPSVPEIISRSIITASFNGGERFDWTSTTGLRVSIPDRHSFARFERASAADIRDRVLPLADVRNQQKRTAPLAERPLAWWFAQLVHYGLPITVDCGQAQESLRRAILGDRLVVPLRLRELETQLKRQYVIYPTVRPGMIEGEARDQPLGRLLKQRSIADDGVKNTQHSRLASTTDAPPSTLRALKLAVLAGNLEPEPKATSFVLDAQEERSDTSSSSESEREATPKPRHLFTPRGTKITKPAEFPGIREREEQKKEKDPGANEEEQIKQQLFRDLANAKAGRNLDNPVAKSDSSNDDSSADGSDSDIPAVATSECKTKAPKSNQDRPLSMAERDLNVENSKVSVAPDQDTDTESLIFYTPMQFLKTRPPTKDDDDNESVIFSGYNHMSEGKKKQPSQRRRRAASGNLKHDPNPPAKVFKRTGSEKGTAAPHAKVKKNVAVISGTKNKPTAIGSVSKQTLCKIGSKLRLSTRAGRVIEISSDEGDGSPSSSEDSGYEVVQSRAENGSAKSRSESGPPISNRPRSDSRPEPSQAAIPDPTAAGKDVPSSAAKPPASTLLSRPSISFAAEHDEKHSGARPCKSSTSKEEPHKAAVFHADAVAPSRRHKKFKEAFKRADSKPAAEDDIRPTDAKVVRVRNYTGCGITEMSGALHANDGETLRKHTVAKNHMWAPGPSVSPVQSLSPQPPLVISRRSASLPRVPSPRGTKFEPPPLNKLFSSQNTVKGSKLVAKGAKQAREQIEIQKSYDPNSVPSLRKELASLPTYLKSSVRHHSPELSHSSPAIPTFRTTPSVGKDMSRRERSCSIGAAATTPRKRSRPSMIDIESIGETSWPVKRPRMSGSHTEVASSATNMTPVRSVANSRSDSGKGKGSTSASAEHRKSQTNSVRDKKGGSESHGNTKTNRRRAKSVGPKK